MESLKTIDLVLQIAGTLGLSILGMLAVAWYNAINTPNTGKFTFFIFWRDNAQSFINSVFGMSIIITIIALVPDASKFLEFLGFSIAIPINGVGALTLGGFIYDQSRKRFKVDKQTKL